VPTLVPNTINEVDAMAFMSFTEGDRVLLIDVRTPALFALSHIKHADNLPLGLFTTDISTVMDQINATGATTLLFYCTKGSSSRAAATAALASELLPEGALVVNLELGFSSWKDAGYPYVGVNRVDAATFKAVLDFESAAGNVYLVDMRSLAQWTLGHIAGAVPVINFDASLAEATLPADKVLMFYGVLVRCRCPRARERGSGSGREGKAASDGEGPCALGDSSAPSLPARAHALTKDTHTHKRLPHLHADRRAATASARQRRLPRVGSCQRTS
jgi:rhodanese-related sulfurtransferase